MVLWGLLGRLAADRLDFAIQQRKKVQMASTKEKHQQRTATEAREHPAFLQFCIVAPNEPDTNDIADWVEDWKMFLHGYEARESSYRIKKD